DPAGEVDIRPIRDDQLAPRAYDTEHVPKGNEGFADEMQDIAGHQHVKSALRERNALRPTFSQFDARRESVAPDGEDFGRGGETRQTCSRVGARELVEQRAGPATDIE